jgi:6-phosphofructokinase 1
MVKKRIAVLTSGGDAPGMNAAIRGVVRKALHHGHEVVGVYRGYQGLINGDFVNMELDSVAGIINKGGTMLKSARSEQFKSDEGFAAAVQRIRGGGIDVVVVIGGEGSMTGARKLSATGIPTIVIPATIDKDMPGTDYTLGFDTALNTILDAVNKIRDTASSHDRVAIIQVMGRHAGHLALFAGLACGAEAILVPEIPYTVDAVCKGLTRSYERGKQHSIIVLAEGAGTGRDIADQIAARTAFSPHVTVLGYIQRGGTPSATDNIAGSRMGAAAVDCINQRQTDCLIASRHGEIVPVPYAAALKEKPAIDKPLHRLAAVLAL